MMTFVKMHIEDIDSVLDLYIDYYNEKEGACWSKDLAYKRIHQVLTMEGSYALALKETNTVVGFAMGYLKQYDDLIGYTLEEIIIDSKFQNRGLGSTLLAELEERVKRLGASCIELKSVNDTMHHHFYGKNGYEDSHSFVDKVKWIA